jgi:predicted TIM-barrel enzyme
MQVFVRDHRTMIAAPIHCDVDGIPKGSHCARVPTLDEAVGRVQAMRDAAVAVNPDILVLCHGGPIAEPGDAGYVLARTTGVCGFFGASSMERLPVHAGRRGAGADHAARLRPASGRPECRLGARY